MKPNRPSRIETLLLRGRVFLWCIAGGAASSAWAQPAPSQPINGEQLNYTVTYEWGPLYLEVGDVSFTTASMGYAGNQLWSFEGWGASRKHWNWFYEVNSIYTSIADSALIPLQFRRHGKEGSHRYDRRYVFQNDSSIACFSSDAELTNLVIHPRALAWDVMTAVHRCRHLPWEEYEPGDTTGINLVLDGVIHPTHLEFVGPTKWTDPTLNQEVPCWEFAPTLIEGTVFKAGDQMRVIVTADSRRLPVFVETELVVGSARIYLHEARILDAVALRTFREETEQKRDNALR
jgi:hypothetical protein